MPFKATQNKCVVKALKAAKKAAAEAAEAWKAYEKVDPDTLHGGKLNAYFYRMGAVAYTAEELGLIEQLMAMQAHLAQTPRRDNITTCSRAQLASASLTWATERPMCHLNAGRGD